MKAFVAVVAALCSSAKAQYPLFPYAGLPAVAAPAAAPVPVATYATAAAPIVGPAVPAPAVTTKFQSQDEFGNTAHGYTTPFSAKHEQGNAHLGVSGSYSYVDTNGVLQTTNYVADGLGFRVHATNLPVAPAAPEVAPLQAPVFDLKAPVFEGKAPAPVMDTPEVAAAKAEFHATFAEVAASRAKRSLPAILPIAPYTPAPVTPFAYTAGPAPAIVPSTGAREAVLTKIQLNPGHAVAYRVDRKKRSVLAPFPLAPAAPFTYAAGPVPAPVPAVVPSAGAREAILTKIQLNPGHAVAYRVD